VYSLAEVCQAQDVARHASPEQQQQDEADAGQLEVAGTSSSPAAGYGYQQAAGSSDPAAMLHDVQQHMVHLTMLLSSRNLWMRPAVLEAPAQDPQYLEAIHKLLDWCPFAVHFVSALDKSCCLSQLVHYQHKLRALQAHVLQGTSLAAMDVLPACPSLVKVRLGVWCCWCGAASAFDRHAS
jgi:hypothetical protein